MTTAKVDARRTVKDFDKSNSMAAALILSKPWAFGGEGSFSVIWARLFQQRQLNNAKVRRERAA